MAAYKLWFRAYPQKKNPTDLNCKEKFEFLTAIGWETFQKMQRARKKGLEYTKAKYWGVME